MACESCRSQARLLLRLATRTSKAPASPIAALPRRHLTTSTTVTKGDLSKVGSKASSSVSKRSHSLQTRSLSSTSARPMFDGLTSGKGAYFVVGATERLYKVCGNAGNYRIKPEDRKNDQVTKLEDGEEVGYSTASKTVWHELFELPPTFSTWSHVTMLHLYLLHARLRCLDREAFANWRQQLVDHFFFDAEKKMHVDHGITSSALRQRYLKDVFVQWRGLLVAYDEGLIKGDAILASAVWRNLFKGSPDVDPRALAAIVGWMRSSLRALEAASDDAFPLRAEEILALPVESFWTGIEKASKTNMPEANQAPSQTSAGGKGSAPAKEAVSKNKAAKPTKT